MATPRWYEVDTIYAGALDGSEAFFDGTPEQNEHNATAYARSEAHSCRVEAAAAHPTSDDGVLFEHDWQVFILPHYCDRDDDECSCRQYDTDHHPTFSSES